MQQQKRYEANLPALPLEDARARVRQLEVRSKETELAIKERELELASRKAVLSGLHMEHRHSERQRTLLTLTTHWGLYKGSPVLRL